MPVSESSEPLSTDSIEDRFLTALQVRPFPVAELLELLVILQSCEQTQRRDDCILVLQETFTENKESEGLIRLFELSSDWFGNQPHLGVEFQDFLSRAMPDRLGQAQLRSVGFGKLPPRESLRRLKVLLACQPGAACMDRTWGFGVVNAVDDFYERITVNFDKRPGHAMTFAYAGEVLKLLDSQHILTFRHANAKRFESLLTEDPAEVVRMAIRSLGPLTVVRLEEEFKQHGLLPKDQEWNKFWSTARTALKRDPLVRVPPASRKTETIALLTKAVNLGDEAWFDEFARKRDVSAILASIIELQGAKLKELDPKSRAVLADRLQFAYQACETARDWAGKARTIMLAVDLGMEELDLESWLKEARDPEFVIKAAQKMNLRDLEKLVALLPLKKDETVALPFIDVLGDLPYSLLEIVLPLLLQGVVAEEARHAVHDIMLADVPSPSLLLWLTRHQGDDKIQALAAPAALVTQCMAALDAIERGERLRMQNLIAKKFEDFGWLEALMIRLDDVERQALYERIQNSRDNWEPPVKRSILGQILKWYPDIQVRH